MLANPFVNHIAGFIDDENRPLARCVAGHPGEVWKGDTIGIHRASLVVAKERKVEVVGFRKCSIGKRPVDAHAQDCTVHLTEFGETLLEGTEFLLADAREGGGIKCEDNLFSTETGQ